MEDGVNKVRGNIGQRDQHKIAFMQTRVRDDERWGIENQVAIEENININKTRAIAKGGRAAQFRLNIFQKGEQIGR